MRSSRVLYIVMTMLGSVVPAGSLLGAEGQAAVDRDLGRADFRYAPPWWQSAICLPDDPDKILVGKEGQVLLDYGHGKVRNFGIVLQPDVDPAQPG